LPYLPQVNPMRRLAYVVIGILVLILALFVAGFAALKSDAARNKIESALSSSHGRPVKLGGIGVIDRGKGGHGQEIREDGRETARDSGQSFDPAMGWLVQGAREVIV
jgi:hypothetical protein